MKRKVWLSREAAAKLAVECGNASECLTVWIAEHNERLSCARLRAARITLAKMEKILREASGK